MSSDPQAAVAFVKGHGTGNDFVLIPDSDGRLELTPEFARALCDRRFGVGGDGAIRIVRTSAEPEAAEYVGQAEFFMDYRNSDGSLSEMCGNGARVFARYLVESGLVGSRTAESKEVTFATRAGVLSAFVHDSAFAPAGLDHAESHGWVSVAMGATRRTVTSDVAVRHGGRDWRGRGVWAPNPHVVVMVDDLSDVGSLEVSPTVDEATFPDGANVEFVHEVGENHVAMRVHERGSGETLSCGTGAVAVAVAVAARDGVNAPTSYRVDVPGGVLQVEIDGNCNTTLSGPTQFVASGELAPSWLATHGVRVHELVDSSQRGGDRS